MITAKQEPGHLAGVASAAGRLWLALPVIGLCRRTAHRSFAALLAGVVLLLLASAPSLARTITDSAGRLVDVPDKISRVAAAGPPAAVLLYVLAPQDMIGWVQAPGGDAKPFLLPAVRDLPELGRLTGHGDAFARDRLIAAKPDLIIDFGTINETYRLLAERVQALTGIPYLLIDGRLDNTPAALRLLGDVLGVKTRGEALAGAAEQIFSTVDRVLAKTPSAARPRIYFADGADGLQTRARDSINTEIIERIGGINVVEGPREKAGPINVGLAQVIAWAPDTIVTLDRDFARTVGQSEDWRPVRAVRDRRVFLSPVLPYGFIDTPPSVNRLIGLTWLVHKLYPEHATGDLREQVRAFYRLFYQVELSDRDVDRLLAPGGE